MLAQQMRSVQPSLVFNQPYFSQSGTGAGYLTLKGLNANGTPIIDQVNPDANEIEGLKNTSALGFLPDFRDVDSTIKLNNYGVPGIRMSDIKSFAYGAINPVGFNPYYERMLPKSKKYYPYLNVVSAAKPTFFTCWLGNNDVLGYAGGGGASSFLTDIATFTANNSEVIDSLTKNGAKGLITTIPDVSSTPFFTTIPYNLIPLDDFSATGINGKLSLLNYFAAIKGLNATRPADDQFDTTSFVVGQNAPLVRDTTLPVPLRSVGRKLRSDEYLLLTLPTGELAKWVQNGYPIPDKYVLTRAEIKAIKERTAAFNQILRDKANLKGLAIFESNDLLKNLGTADGVIFDGINVSPKFITGGAFSLDGVHLTPRGYAIVANGMIQAINKKYGASLPELNLSQYPGVKFPN